MDTRVIFISHLHTEQSRAAIVDVLCIQMHNLSAASYSYV